jgi:hypothetical protein
MNSGVKNLFDALKLPILPSRAEPSFVSPQVQHVHTLQIACIQRKLDKIQDYIATEYVNGTLNVSGDGLS